MCFFFLQYVYLTFFLIGLSAVAGIQVLSYITPARNFKHFNLSLKEKKKKNTLPALKYKTPLKHYMEMV